MNHRFPLAALLAFSGVLSDTNEYFYSRLSPKKEIPPSVHATVALSPVPKQKESDLERAVRECDFDTKWDERHSADLLRDSASARVILFGIGYDSVRGGDPRDGMAVAHALPYLKSTGWKYVAVEGPASLNQYVGTLQLEPEAKKV